MKETKRFEDNARSLNLQENEDGIFICKGRIQGDYPKFIPSNHRITKKFVQQAHLQTFHGEVGLTMAKTRDVFWVPKLQSIIKRVRKNCSGCKRFQISSLPAPPDGNLPRER